MCVRPPLPEKCVLLSSESGYLSCSFDDGLCGWIRDKDGDLHWETTPDPSGNWRVGVNYSPSRTLISKIVYFFVSKWKWEWLCSFTGTHTYANTHRLRQSKQLNFVLLNYRSRWKLLEGSSLSFLQISALLYKAVQMRSGLRDPSVIPVAHIKWEHNTVFLGVQTRRKCDELCWEDAVDGVWRLNSAAHWHCLSDTNYIWLPLPTGLVLQLLVCFQTLRLSLISAKFVLTH